MSSQMRSAYTTGGDSRAGRRGAEVSKGHSGPFIPMGSLQRLFPSAKLELDGVP